MVAIAAIAGLVISLGIAATSTKKYTGTSSVLIRASNLQTLIDPNAAQNSEDPARLTATNLLLVTSTAVADLVKSSLGTKESSSDLVSQINASANPDADILTIQATDPNPERAANVANAFADQFVGFERTQAQQQADAGAARLRSEIASLPPTATAQLAQLQQALRNVLALRAVTTGDATVIDRASKPLSATSPNPKRSAALGLLAGLAIGLAAVFLSDLFDRRIKAIEDFENAYDTRAIGSVPRMTRSQPLTSPQALESFRILRSALSYLAPDSEVRTALITSAVVGEGKTTVSVGLAYAAASAGQQVVLVEADVRRPTFRKHFELGSETRGLTTALVSDVSLEELLVQPVDSLPTLRVLPGGPFLPHTSDLLASRGMNQVLEELADSTDLVIVDSPPLLPVADAQVLLEQPGIDAVLIVCRTYMTTRDQVRRCRAVLERQFVANDALVVVGGHEPTEYGYEPTPNGGRRRRTAAQRTRT